MSSRLTKTILAVVAVVSAAPVAAQTQSGYPSGSPNDLMARMEAIRQQAQARRDSMPVVNWSEAQIRAAARRAVTDRLRDPESARFRNVRRIQLESGTSVFCGEINAHNGAGGYAGYVRFEATVSNRGTTSAQVDGRGGISDAYFSDSWRQVCGRMAGVDVRF